MLPRQPYTRSGAWHTVPHPGHGGAECARSDHRVGQVCLRSLRVDDYVARDSCLRTSGHGQHLTVMERMPSRRLEACATGSYHTLHEASYCLPRDLRVMHSCTADAANQCSRRIGITFQRGYRCQTGFPVSRHLACSSTAAALTVLSIRREWQRLLRESREQVWSSHVCQS